MTTFIHWRESRSDILRGQQCGEQQESVIERRGLKYHRVINMRRSVFLLALISAVLFAQDTESLRREASAHANEVKPHIDLGNAYLNGTPPDFKLADEEFRRVLELEPNNKEACYSLGMIVWSRWYPVWLAARTKLHMNLSDPGPLPEPVRQEMKAEYYSMLEEGISNLNRAMQIDPDYYQAMQTLNLLIAGRADLRDTKEEYASDVAAAKRRQREMEARRAPTPPAIPPPPPSPDGRPTRVRVGGNVQAANFVKKVEPVYPEDARKARVSGLVRFTVIVNRDGTIRNIQLVSGHPLLVDAAKDAVAQWVYRPTSLDGHPVEVITTVDVNFVLGN